MTDKEIIESLVDLLKDQTEVAKIYQRLLTKKCDGKDLDNGDFQQSYKAHEISLSIVSNLTKIQKYL